LHREKIIELLKDINPESVLELGCGRGENLLMIKKAFPNAKVVGTDIDDGRYVGITQLAIIWLFYHSKIW